MIKYFIYCRKSSEDEERQVLSIEAQLTELREFAKQNSLFVVKEFYDELEKVASEINRILKSGKVMGWVIADQWIKKKFTPVGFLLWQRLEKYFEPVEIVCLTRHNQTSNTGIWHERARQYNFYLRGFKYLFIMRSK